MNALPTTILLLALVPLPTLCAQTNAVLALPPPQIDSGHPLLEVLKDRRTVREFSTRALSEQTLSNLLWAGFGTNRVDGRRTAPSAMNAQEIDLYVALSQGAYRYDASSHALHPVASEDLRALTGGQDFVGTAPVALVFVADLTRLARAEPDDRERYAWFDAGSVSQNLYLLCAAEGLGVVVHELNREPIAAALKLGPEQRIILAQSVGYPKGP